MQLFLGYEPIRSRSLLQLLLCDSFRNHGQSGLFFSFVFLPKAKNCGAASSNKQNCKQDCCANEKPLTLPLLPLQFLVLSNARIQEFAFDQV